MKNSLPTKTVVVIGMHRSGTSITAGIISLLGIRMGATGKPVIGNVRGDFEDQDFRALNREILAAHNARWNDPPVGEQMIIDPELSEKTAVLIRSKQGGIWGWKDPRTVFTLEYYLPHIVNPYYIFVSRDPNEVARSLHKRDYTPVEQNLRLTKQYERQINKVIRKTDRHPQLFLTMEEITRDPVENAEAIASFLDLKVSAPVYDKVRAFILPPRKRRLIKIILQARYIHKAPRYFGKYINRNKQESVLCKVAYKSGKKY